MPTATQYFDYGAINAGPLTTTWTAAAACATDNNSNLYVAYPRGGGDGYALNGQVKCDTSTHDQNCYPSAKELAAKFSTYSQVDDIVYFSPGLHCPSGWTTAGTAVGGSAGFTSAAGVFATQSATTTLGGLGGHLPILLPLEVFEGVLDPSETLAVCCPSGFTVEGVVGGCYSSIGPASSYNVTGYCNQYAPVTEVATVTSFDGSAYPDGLISYSKLDGPIGTMRETLPVSNDYAIVTAVAVVALIHKESDLDSAAGAVQPGFRSLSLVSIMTLALGVLAGANVVSLW